MKYRVTKSRRCRRFGLHLILALSLSHLLVACGNDSTGNQEKDAATISASQSDGSSAATELTARAECSDLERFKSVAHLSWRPAKIPGTGQRVDVTIFKDGFETERFASSKALPADANSFLFADVKGQALHRWRVITVNDNDLFSSEIARFEGVVCVGDVVIDRPPVPVP